jgi:hypothetical protein
MDNLGMATKVQRAKPVRRRKAAARPLNNARLLKLAAKHRPPQSWYDEQVDPTKPEL